MRKFISFSIAAVIASACVHHLPTPKGPRATLISDSSRVQACEFLGVFEETGETQEQAREMLQIHVHELGATHVLLEKKRTINTKKTFNETWRNNDLFTNLGDNMVVASGKGYKCR